MTADKSSFPTAARRAALKWPALKIYGARDVSGWRQCCIGTEGLACSVTELWPGRHGTVIGEADEAMVEGGVP